MRLAIRFALFAILAGVSAHAFAGPLVGHPGATLGSGTTPYNNGFGLSGTVDWAVFPAALFPFGGYAPTPGQVVYAYQVYNTGPLEVSALGVEINAGEPVNNIGSFITGGTEVFPSSSFFSPVVTPTSANWQFLSPNVLTGENSSGLAFSSPRIPTMAFGSVIDGGTSAFVIPLPTPSPVDIPEPASATLAVLCLASLGLLGLGRKVL